MLVLSETVLVLALKQSGRNTHLAMLAIRDAEHEHDEVPEPADSFNVSVYRNGAVVSYPFDVRAPFRSESCRSRSSFGRESTVAVKTVSQFFPAKARVMTRISPIFVVTRCVECEAQCCNLHREKPVR